MKRALMAEQTKTWFDAQWKRGVANVAGRVLDFGCGTSTEPVCLAQLPGVDHVYAYDIGMDRQWVQSAIEEYGCADRVTIVIGPDELERLASASFDTAFCWNVTEHLECPIAEFERVANLLKPGGLWSIRHHCYYSYMDGHHLLIPFYLDHENEEWRHRLQFGAHLSDSDAFIRTHRHQIRGMTLNMMTLFQVRAFLILAGFEIVEWEVQHWPDTTGIPRSLDISELDATAGHLHVVARKEP